MMEAYGKTQEGRAKVKNLVLIDSADVEILKLSFYNMHIDISIKQVSILCCKFP